MAMRERLPVGGRRRGVGMYRRIVCYRKGMETDAQAGLERECQWDWYEVAKGNGSGVERKGGGEWKWVGKQSGGKYYLKSF